MLPAASRRNGNDSLQVIKKKKNKVDGNILCSTVRPLTDRSFAVDQVHLYYPISGHYCTSQIYDFWMYRYGTYTYFLDIHLPPPCPPRSPRFLPGVLFHVEIVGVLHSHGAGIPRCRFAASCSGWPYRAFTRDSQNSKPHHAGR